MTLDGQPALLGGPARDRHDRARHRHRRPQPGRGLRGRRPRLHARSSTATRRGSPTTRRSGRSSARSRRSRSQYYGFDTAQAAVRRRPRPPGVRDGRRLAADRRASARRTTTSRRRHLDGPARHPGPVRRATSCRRTIPAQARALLAEAGFPGGAGFPATTLMTGGGGADEAVLDEIQRELGITLELRDDGLRRRTSRGSPTDPPAIWSLGWVADYPGRNDFLGVLLGERLDEQLRRLVVAGVRCRHRRGRRRDRPGRRGRGLRPRPRRSSRATCRSSRSATARAGRSSRDGLLGAGENGLGIVRMAGLAWAD